MCYFHQPDCFLLGGWKEIFVRFFCGIMTISKLLWYFHQSDCYSIGKVEGNFSEVLWDLCKISLRVLWDFCEISISQIVILLGGWKEISQILAHSASEERYRGSFIAGASFFIAILVMSSLPSLLQPSPSSRADFPAVFYYFCHGTQ